MGCADKRFSWGGEEGLPTALRAKFKPAGSPTPLSNPCFHSGGSQFRRASGLPLGVSLSSWNDKESSWGSWLGFPPSKASLPGRAGAFFLQEGMPRLHFCVAASPCAAGLLAPSQHGELEERALVSGTPSSSSPSPLDRFLAGSPLATAAEEAASPSSCSCSARSLFACGSFPERF